jgi:acetyl esterase/lipase
VEQVSNLLHSEYHRRVEQVGNLLHKSPLFRRVEQVGNLLHKSPLFFVSMNARTLIVFLAVLFFTRTATPQNNTPPPALPGGTARIYKTIGETKLPLHIFTPENHKPSDKRAAIVFFFGGGWTNGTPAQFLEHCKYLASRGMVAITVEYRVKSRHNVSPVECVNDAKSALRWVRAHAAELGIDANRIAAGGGSAGGHLAAAVATVNGFDEKDENLNVSAAPNALVLFNPALDLAALKLAALTGEKILAISPQQAVAQHAKGKLPPTIIFHGTADTTVPFAQATAFCAALKEKAARCEIRPAEGRTHGYFNFGRGDGVDFKTTLQATDVFLTSLGYLKGEPTLK